MKESVYFGFKRIDFDFCGREAIIVFPKTSEYKKEWMLKTEYFGAFFERIEKQMLENGYILVYLQNVSRWGTSEDQAAKRKFADFLHEKYGVEKRCICIGMSCGGFHAVCFATQFPSYVSLLYLDAPLLSFDGWNEEFAESEREKWRSEQMSAYGFKTLAELNGYKDCPINKLDILTDNNIPVALVYGGSDTIVDCKKNSEALINHYQKHNAPIKFWCKPNCDHHPHGLEDSTEIIKFIDNYKL